VSSDPELSTVQFEPLRPATRKRILLGLVIGPLLWLVSLVVVALVLHYTSAIELGLLVAAISAVVAAVALVLMRTGRVREEKRYAARG
jgi:hypothetical protein